MAVSIKELHGLFNRGHNDNLPLPSELRTQAPIVQLRKSAADLNIDMPNIETSLEPTQGILWAYMKHTERACFTPALMQDGQDLFRFLKETYSSHSNEDIPFRYFVWASRSNAAWSLGGDLSTFTKMIREKDEIGLRNYAYRSIDVLYDNYMSLDLPIMTVALVNGDAIGGGYEAMLTSDLVIAERHAKFGLPEILFNLFPGMGAHAFLSRKVGKKTARMLIEDGRTRSAEEMQELGLVDIVCDTGKSAETLEQYAEENARMFHTKRLLQRAIKRVDPVHHQELIDIVDMWVELALQLSTDDLRRMDCLARHQQKKRAVAA